jgi:hypothetical protein
MNAKPRQEYQPELEPLEDRCLLSAPGKFALNNVAHHRRHQESQVRLHPPIHFRLITFPAAEAQPATPSRNTSPGVIFHPDSTDAGLVLPAGSVFVPGPFNGTGTSTSTSTSTH